MDLWTGANIFTCLNSSLSVESWLTFLIVDKQRPKFEIYFIRFINWGRSFLFPAACSCSTAGITVAWLSSTKSNCTIQICWIGRQKTKNCSAKGSKWFVPRGMNSYSISKNHFYYQSFTDGLKGQVDFPEQKSTKTGQSSKRRPGSASQIDQDLNKKLRVRTEPDRNRMRTVDPCPQTTSFKVKHYDLSLLSSSMKPWWPSGFLCNILNRFMRFEMALEKDFIRLEVL